jgi:hypothetical protein
MGRTIDPNIHLGERYCRLVIKEYDHKDQFGRYIYKCQCDCGNTAIVAYTSMRIGHTTSCGCLQSNKVSQKDLSHIGETWGRMTIIAFDHTDRAYNKWYRARCRCGNEKVVTYGSLKHGQVISCGCYSKEVHTKHGMSHDRIYVIWKNMNDRCYDKNHKSYSSYGGRGIEVCDQWKDPIDGLKRFQEWAMTHGYAEDLSIDRIDNDGNYEPANCRWVDKIVQMNNKSSNVYVAYLLNKDSDPPYLVYTYAEWARIVNIDYLHFRRRILCHGNTNINRVIEDCYREGHNVSENSTLIMHIDDDIVAMNHVNNFSNSIHD